MSDTLWPISMFPRQMLQWLKSYLPGQASWQSELENSGLPANIKSQIREIVQQTRLLRFEKAEIVNDLVNHFRDGHQRGQSYEQLVSDFGATEVAVSLFRSGKLRSRPMSVKAFRGSAIPFGGGIISYIMLQVFFHAAKPNPSVDYTAKLNEVATSMPEDQKAWPLYCDTWAKYGLVEEGSWRFEEFWFEEDSADAPEVEWTDHTTHLRLIRLTDPGWEKAEQKLESIGELLVTLREGSKRPYVGAPLYLDPRKYSDKDLAIMRPGWSREQVEREAQQREIDPFGLVEPVSEEAGKLLAGSTFGILLPHIQQFRRAARILHVDTRYAMKQGDQRRVVENVNAIMRLGEQAGNNPVIVCSLVGVSIRGIGMEVVEELVVEHGDVLTDETLEHLQHSVANLDFQNAFDLTFEKNFILDFIQRIYSDDGNGDGRITAVGTEVLHVLKSMFWRFNGKTTSWHENAYVRMVAGPVQLFSAPTRKEMEALVDELYLEFAENMKTTMWQEDVIPDRETIEERDPSGLLLSSTLGLSNLKQSREASIARQDAVLLALAVHRFKRNNKSWPLSLDELKNKWIDRTPIDRLSGKPLRFTIRDGQPVIYSLGHDGDDDGGDAKELSSPAWLDRETDGDWILWPSQDL